MTDIDFVRVEHDGAISKITVNRPDRLNALDGVMLEQIHRAADALLGRGQTRCAILTGEGRAFVAGADIAAMKSMSAEEARAFSAKGHAAFDALEALPFPVIAAVNGFALGGGCELALACDFVYASRAAKFGQPEVKLGVVPGFGATQRLMRRVGIARARELLYTGNVIDAEEARRIGLANAVFEPDELLTAARRTADAIAQTSPNAIAEAKQLVREGEGMTLGGGNALEIEAFGRCFGHGDAALGMAAFLEKRPPSFRDR